MLEIPIRNTASSNNARIRTTNMRWTASDPGLPKWRQWGICISWGTHRVLFTHHVYKHKKGENPIEAIYSVQWHSKHAWISRSLIVYAGYSEAVPYGIVRLPLTPTATTSPDAGHGVAEVLNIKTVKSHKSLLRHRDMFALVSNVRILR